MESMIIQLDQKCSAISLLYIDDILRCKPGLRLSSIDMATKWMMVIFNPTFIDADTIIESLLQKGYDINYFCKVA